MFAGCMDRMKHDACGDCVRRDPCHFLFRNLFGIGRAECEVPAEPQPRRTNPFLAFLGEVAKGVEARSKPRETPFRRDIERRLEEMLPAGPVRIEELARALGLSRQTLYRRLKAEGTTFEKVLDALRHRLALRLVRDENVPVKEAAWRLGFSDPAAFSRAFKRWTGRSPRDFRGQPG